MHLNVFWPPEKQRSSSVSVCKSVQTYVLVEGIINLRGTGQVLLFVPLLGFVLSVLSIKKILRVMGWCNSHSGETTVSYLQHLC